MSFSYPNRHASDEEMDEACETVWAEFWLPFFEGEGCPPPVASVVKSEHGQAWLAFLAQVKSELYDAKRNDDSLGTIIEHVSGGQVSKTNIDPRQLCSIADDQYADDHRENIADWLENVADPQVDNVTAAEVLQSLRAWCGITVDGEVPSDPLTQA